MSFTQALFQEQFLAGEREREERLNDAWAKYHGVWREKGSNFGWPKPLSSTRTDPQANDCTKINFARLIVNKVVSALFGYDLDFEIDGERESEAEQYLKSVFEANRGMVFFHKLGVNGGVCGQVFVRIDYAVPGVAGPRLIVWDPARVSVRWDPRDYERVVSYSYYWNAVDPARGSARAYRQVVYEESPGRWIVTEQTSEFGRMNWVDVMEPVAWPFPWCPVVTAQNLPVPNEFWGQSDIESDITHINEVINFSISNLQRILRLNAHPITWGSGLSGESIVVDPGMLLKLPEGATLQNLEMQSDMQPALSHIENLRQLLHELARIPEVSTGRVENVGQLSGVALKILYAPLLDLVETKRLTYGALIQELGDRVLELGGYGAGHSVKVQWPDVIPGDTEAEARVATMYRELGVSQDTVLSRLGFDPEQEREKRDEEAGADESLVEALLARYDRGEQGPLPRGVGAGDDDV